MWEVLDYQQQLWKKCFSSKPYLLQSDLSVSLDKIDTCSMMYVIELGHFLHNFYLICVVELSF